MGAFAGAYFNWSRSASGELGVAPAEQSQVLSGLPHDYKLRVDLRVGDCFQNHPSDGSPHRATRIPRAVRLMRTISVVLGLVGVILVMTPCQPGSPTRMSIPALGVDAPIETIGLDRRALPDDSGQAPLGAPMDRRKAGWYAVGVFRRRCG